MTNIISFKSKSDIKKEKLDMIDKKYEKELNESDSFTKQILLKTENGGKLTDDDVDNMILDLALHSMIKDEKDNILNSH